MGWMNKCGGYYPGSAGAACVQGNGGCSVVLDFIGAGGGRVEGVAVLCDTGAHLSLVSPGLVRLLGLEGEERRVEPLVVWLADRSAPAMVVDRAVVLRVQVQGGAVRRLLVRVADVPVPALLGMDVLRWQWGVSLDLPRWRAWDRWGVVWQLVPDRVDWPGLRFASVAGTLGVKGGTGMGIEAGGEEGDWGQVVRGLFNGAELRAWDQESRRVMRLVREQEGLPDISDEEAKARLNVLGQRFLKPMAGDPGKGESVRMRPLDLRRFVRRECLGSEYWEHRWMGQKKWWLTDVEARRLAGLGRVRPAPGSRFRMPVVAVEKKGGRGVRLCVDGQPFNALLRVTSGRLPKIVDLQDKTAGMRVFSLLDLPMAFLQVPLARGCQERFTFNTASGPYCFTHLPFGVAVASGVFQAVMETVLGPELLGALGRMGQFVDDTMVGTVTRRAHLSLLEHVLRRLAAFGVKLSPDKCKLMQSSVRYLGYVVDRWGVRPDGEELRAFMDQPRPSCRADLQAFIGKVRWHMARFAPRVAELLVVLQACLKRQRVGQKLDWGRAEQDAWEELRRQAALELGNRHFDEEKPVIIAADASAVSLAAVLMQPRVGYESKSRWSKEELSLVRAASRVQSPFERCGCMLEKEARALLYGLRKFTKYIEGREVLAQSDHLPLVRLMSGEGGGQRCSPKVRRLLEALGAYKLKMEWVPGVENVADWWTRWRDSEDEPVVIDGGDEGEGAECEDGRAPEREAARAVKRRRQRMAFEAVTRERLGLSGGAGSGDGAGGAMVGAVLARADEAVGQALGQGDVPWCGRPGRQGWTEADVKWVERQEVREGPLGVEVKGRGGVFRQFVPQCMVGELLARAHGVRHVAEGGMLRQLRPFVWPTKGKDVLEFVRMCACVMSKNDACWPIAAREWRQIRANAPGDMVAWDIYKYGAAWWLTAVDVYSGMPWVYRLHDKTAQSVRKGIDRWMSESGGMRVFLADGGPEWALVTDVVRRKSPAYHKQGNGVVERFHRELGKQCRIHRVQPDEAVVFLRTRAQRAAWFDRGGRHRHVEGGDGEVGVEQEGEGAGAEGRDEDRPERGGGEVGGRGRKAPGRRPVPGALGPRAGRVGYRDVGQRPARQFRVGQIVRRFVRKGEQRAGKQVNPYSGVAVVEEVVSDRMYRTWDGRTRTRFLDHVDELGLVPDLGDRIESEGWELAERRRRELKRNWGIRDGEWVEVGSQSPGVAIGAGRLVGKRVVYLGVRWLGSWLDWRDWWLLDRKADREIVVIVPDLRWDPLYRWMVDNSGAYRVDWEPLPDDDGVFRRKDGGSVGRVCFSWWVCRIRRG